MPETRAVTVASNEIAGAGLVALAPRQVVEQVQLIQQMMKDVMHEGEHYGKIPGCGDKPTLLKAGAEKLSFTFRLAPTYEIRRDDLPNGHREFEVVCTLTHINTQAVLAQGVGSCTTMESKYRFRPGLVVDTGKPVPREYWDLRTSDPKAAQAALGGHGLSTKKIDGVWHVVEKGETVENDNPADQYNTVLKMAKKRAYVDAILSATAASDIFTQDLEDMHGSSGLAVVETVTPPPTSSAPPVEPKPVPPSKTEPQQLEESKVYRIGGQELHFVWRKAVCVACGAEKKDGKKYRVSVEAGMCYDCHKAGVKAPAAAQEKTEDVNAELPPVDSYGQDLPF
jgi:hypothetical protein